MESSVIRSHRKRNWVPDSERPTSLDHIIRHRQASRYANEYRQTARTQGRLESNPTSLAGNPAVESLYKRGNHTLQCEEAAMKPRAAFFLTVLSVLIFRTGLSSAALD